MKRLLCSLLLVLMLCGCAAPAGTTPTTVPGETDGPRLKAGFYIYDQDEAGTLPVHFRFFEDGTGYLSMVSMEAALTWTPEGTLLGLADGAMKCTPTDDGMIWEGQSFTFNGDSLPEGFIPDAPAPGVYAVSSVSRNGNVEFYGTFTKSNGYLELKEDGTGLLVFDDAKYPFTMDGTTACFDGWTLMLLDLGTEEPGAAPLVMVYIMDGPIPADSIAFRKLEE